MKGDGGRREGERREGNRDVLNFSIFGPPSPLLSLHLPWFQTYHKWTKCLPLCHRGQIVRFILWLLLLNCMKTNSAFWKRFCANSSYWGCIIPRRVEDCCKHDSWSKRRGYPLYCLCILWAEIFICLSIFNSSRLSHTLYGITRTICACFS